MVGALANHGRIGNVLPIGTIEDWLDTYSDEAVRFFQRTRGWEHGILIFASGITQKRKSMITIN